MYTVEDIRGAAFARDFRGYSIDEVDDFIDQCADTVQELQRQNAENAKKLEILTERLMEYRKEEDSIHTALLSAQRAGDAMLREAQQKADLTLQDASIKAEKAHEIMTREISQEQEELERVRRDVTQFKEELLELYRTHILRVQEMPQFETEEPAEETPVVAEPEEQPIEEEAPAVEEAELIEDEPLSELPAEDGAELPDDGAELPEDGAEILPGVELEDMDEEEEGEAELEFEPIADIFSNSDDEEEAPATESKFANLEFGPDYEIGDSKFFKRK